MDVQLVNIHKHREAVSMKIDMTTVSHIAKLARLSISEQEAQDYAAQLANVLNHFEQISKIDTKGVEPLITPTEIDQFWRKDEVKQDFKVDAILENAPQKTGNLFTVPPVV